jgi:hypothetical protein
MSTQARAAASMVSVVSIVPLDSSVGELEMTRRTSLAAACRSSPPRCSARRRSVTLTLLVLTRSLDAMPTHPIRTRRWTRIEYERLIEVGVFRPGDPVELLGGDLVVSEPQGSAHHTAIGLVEDALRATFGPGWVVRTQGPIALDDESEPEPDIAVAPGSRRDYSHQHPARPVLVVEVSESSLRLDREHKGGLYARAGLTTTGCSTWSIATSRCTDNRPPIRPPRSAGALP